MNKSWKIAPLPDNKTERLGEFANYEIFDTSSEIAFDRLGRMAAQRFRMPIALVSLVDKDRQLIQDYLLCQNPVSLKSVA